MQWHPSNWFRKRKVTDRTELASESFVFDCIECGNPFSTDPEDPDEDSMGEHCMDCYWTKRSIIGELGTEAGLWEQSEEHNAGSGDWEWPCLQEGCEDYNRKYFKVVYEDGDHKGGWDISCNCEYPNLLECSLLINRAIFE
jgi:hypothetical protein